MYLYDDPTVTASLPASTGEGTPGYFTDGNPAGGQAATILRAEFMNMLMMELVNAITGAGIPLSKSTFTQLKSAIEAYITARTATATAAGIVELATSAETQTGTDALRAVTPAGLSARTATEARTGVVELATTTEAEAGTDTTRAVTPAGLVSFLAANLLNATTSTAGKVELATSAEMADGTDTARVPPVAAIMNLFSKRSFTSNDYIRFPDVDGGLIIQWMAHSSVSGTHTLTFPIAFPTSCHGVLCTTRTAQRLQVVNSMTTTGASISCKDSTSSSDGAAAYYAFAVGN